MRALVRIVHASPFVLFAMRRAADLGLKAGVTGGAAQGRAVRATNLKYFPTQFE
jgi:hypothetical protein